MPCPLRYIALVSSLAIVTFGSVKASELIEAKTYTELFFDFITGRFLFQFFGLQEEGKEARIENQRKEIHSISAKKQDNVGKNSYGWVLKFSRKFLGLAPATSSSNKAT